MRVGFWALLAVVALVDQAVSVEPPSVVQSPPDFYFLDTSIENASPLFWDFAADGSIVISLLYDHQRCSPNRAAGHWLFRLDGRPDSTHTLVLKNFDNIWNGKHGSPVSKKTFCTISEDGRTWRTVPAEWEERPQIRLQATVGPAGSLYVARIEPYRISDVDRLLGELKASPLTQIEKIGESVEGRPLVVVRAGREDAKHRVFLRARAHPWESGGNWVVQGFLRELVAHPSADLCAYVLPMANPDGVAHGRTRFNLKGWDLNRNWDEPAPKDLSPENFALEQWLAKQAAAGKKPHLALDLHNDNSGKLHVSRPDVPDLAAYLDRMKRLEAALRKHTWFTEGATGGNSRNPGTLGEGWLERFGVSAAVLEFNIDWIAGKQKAPLGADWEELGRQLPKVFAEYFAAER